jgi:hypothetical protein
LLSKSLAIEPPNDEGKEFVLPGMVNECAALDGAHSAKAYD